MARFTSFIDSGFFLSLADIEAHSEAFAIRLALTYAEEAARLYAARVWDPTAAYWDGPAIDLIVIVAPMDENGKVTSMGTTHHTKFVPREYGDDERRLLTPLNIPGVFPIPLTIKEC
jgi:hypothetical protein